MEHRGQHIPECRRPPCLDERAGCCPEWERYDMPELPSPACELDGQAPPRVDGADLPGVPQRRRAEESSQGVYGSQRSVRVLAPHASSRLRLGGGIRGATVREREPGCLHKQVILFRDVCGAARGTPVAPDGGLVVARHFEKMGADGLQAV